MSVSHTTRSVAHMPATGPFWSAIFKFAIQISDPISSTDEWQRSVFLVPSILGFGKERVNDRPAEKYAYFLS